MNCIKQTTVDTPKGCPMNPYSKSRFSRPGVVRQGAAGPAEECPGSPFPDFLGRKEAAKELIESCFPLLSSLKGEAHLLFS